MQMTMRKRGKESVSSVRKIGGRRRRREREKEKEVEVAVVERKRENSRARALALFFVPSLAIIIPRQCGMTFPRGVEVKTEECLEKRNLSREYFPLSHSLSRALGVSRSNFREGKKKGLAIIIVAVPHKKVSFGERRTPPRSLLLPSRCLALPLSHIREVFLSSLEPDSGPRQGDTGRREA